MLTKQAENLPFFLRFLSALIYFECANMQYFKGMLNLWCKFLQSWEAMAILLEDF